MIAIPIVALIVGALAALLSGLKPLTGVEGQYLAVACLAGFDTVVGGVRGGIEGRFDTKIFFSGFLMNIVIAFLLAYLGDKIYINLYLVVAFVFGNRIFSNLSLIRRSMVTKIMDERARRKRQSVLSSPTSEPQA